jgi:hypothetical protein
MTNSLKKSCLDVFNAEMVKGADLDGFFKFPLLKQVNYVPQKLVPFDRIKNAAKDQWVHFYIHDYKFTCVWNHYKRYLELFRKFEGLIAPDFSVYRNMPLALQIYSIYRSRAVGYWFQANGVKVIPNVRWGDECTLGFAFDGLEKGGTVAVGSYGGIKDKENRYYFQIGLAEMVRKLNPDSIVVYGPNPEAIFAPYKQAGIHIIAFDNYAKTRREATI